MEEEIACSLHTYGDCPCDCHEPRNVEKDNGLDYIARGVIVACIILVIVKVAEWVISQ